ncbi:MAG: TerB family tellurite resistance protein [Planctomycetes bacterium]|nr:TerB family tellurite resistance protein [Planctomycetota bacterium]
MEFVCSFAWTDLTIADEERKLIEEMANGPEFDDTDRIKIRGWLESPPPIDDVDPTRIPLEHRQQFLDAIRQVLRADGRVANTERDSLAIFEELVRTAK